MYALTMIRLSGSVKEDIAKPPAPKEEDLLAEPNGVAFWQGSVKPLTFDLTYSEEKGWSEPQHPILNQISRKIYKGKRVPLKPHGPRITATLWTGDEQHVASTVDAIIDRFSDDWTIELPSGSEGKTHQMNLVRPEEGGPAVPNFQRIIH